MSQDPLACRQCACYYVSWSRENYAQSQRKICETLACLLTQSCFSVRNQVVSIDPASIELESIKYGACTAPVRCRPTNHVTEISYRLRLLQ